ncbi:RNA polymerase sigma-70 factor, ECF subfamily [Nonomuraea maritima]|uniref:RNA polymerase sigma-70 factor, ECF subfamily n=1 Tax=Nonomuraea maritima TaxID=683260 RepID=A0A1G8RZ70_9ACTN|nr:sigma factor [Nonomuraea maritima]SDJ22257.1 RNA polymerase sigma-70 factor, ECF subfamily [Nonomuraea maritima]
MSEIELRARLIAGDLDALAAAYDGHAPHVYGVAVTVTGDPAQAEEITRNAFVALWERPSAYDPGLGSLRGWLVSRARHEAAVRTKTG